MMGRTGPLVDVVIPVFNGERTIRAAVESVLQQTYRHIHVIVVDDGSTDGTRDVLREVEDPRLEVVTRPHAGVSATRNTGIAAGSGDFVVFVDADDECDPGWLSVMVDLADGAAVVGCAGRIQQQGRPDRVKAPVRGDDGRVWPVFLAGLFLVRRDILERAGGYDPRLARSENTDLGYRVTDVVKAAGEGVAVTDEILVTIRRPREQAAKYSPQVRRDSAETLLVKNPQWVSQEPRRAGTYRAMAGYAALREGDLPAARSHLHQAVRLHPRRLKYWVLLARTWMPRSRRGG
jgi:glycosyltransferase involved in cell wall biosynthesis